MRIPDLLLTGLMLVGTAYAQDHFSCGIEEKQKQLYEAYPELEDANRQLIERSKEVTYTRSGDREVTYTIPVVFHIVHENGVENISDAQVLDQLEILNRDFAKENADTSAIVDEFQDIAAETPIRFKLANKDPYGNCTNGIEHIYSYETNNGDDHSKRNAWPRTRYLNIWVVKSMSPGVAGYAYFPSDVSGMALVDGIIILHNFIGSIGTGNVTNSRALTHEVGHWLGLPHTWGPNNNPGVACGDDGVDDTPVTAGHTSCDLDAATCTAGVVENVQNYMEYAYCSNMFTQGQADLMEFTLNQTVGSRDNLWTEVNHASTGIDGEAELCTPLPDFYQSRKIICSGESLTYFASVQRAEVAEYTWYFQGGTPSFSSDPDVTVTYNEPGIYDVILTTTNAAGAETITKEDQVYVFADYWHHEGPYLETFEGSDFDTDDWVFENVHNDSVEWDLSEVAGYSGNHALVLHYYKADLDPVLDINYYERQEGSVDRAITPAYNLSQTSGATLNFKYIFGSKNAGTIPSSDLELKVEYRDICGGSWQTLEILNNGELLRAGFFDDGFYPTVADEWQNVSISLPAAAQTTNVRFRFSFTAEDFSNNFYLDDINVTGTLGGETFDTPIQYLDIYPNPANADQEVMLSFYLNQSENVEIQLYDIAGNLIAAETLAAVQGENVQALRLQGRTLSAGMYQIVLSSAHGRATRKLVVN